MTTAPQRVIRRVSRTAGVSTSDGLLEAARKRAEADIEQELQSIAERNRQITEATRLNDESEKRIGELMTTHKIPSFTDGVLKASYKDKFTNTVTEIDPRALFNHKHLARENFFKCVKVQLGELKNFLAVNEITAISKITAPKKIGSVLVVEPVKAVATIKPTSMPRKKK